MRIAIVDDDTMFIEKVEAVLGDFEKNTGEEMAVRRFREGTGLLDEVMSKRNYDLYILDVEMPKLDGLDLARRIRETEKDANIIFLSNYEKYALPAYKVRAYDYIMKAEYEKEIPPILERIQEEKQKEMQEGAYLIQTATWAKVIRFHEVLYLLKEKKYVVFYCTDGQQYRERTTLGDVYPKLPPDQFIYINKSCIVNMRHVLGLRDDVITMDMGNEKLFVSRGKNSMVWDKMITYWGKRRN